MMDYWICPRCKHDHLDPPWRAGDEDICNATMGPLVCGCTVPRPKKEDDDDDWI